MAGAFLIMLREGFEAALIVGIILAVVVRVGEARFKRHVFAGVGVAILVSLLFALVADRVSDLFGGAGQEVLNGCVLMLAAAMITYVVVWLKESRKGIHQQLAAEVHRTVEGHGMGVFVLAFLSVFREGVESVLFLWGILAGGREDVGAVLTGGLLGLVSAVLIAWAVFQGGRRIPLGTFFNATTGLLVLLAAGMLAHGVGYWVAVDWLPALAYAIWDTSNVLPERSGVGALLAVLIGYNANPTLMEVLVWGGYLGAVGGWLWWGSRTPGAESPSAPAA
ncbi:MAG: FTR1 family protein [Nitrospirota bacterium]|nr:FTR1 family protein [Nitrospirota bacterium]